jgi:hypothetical protein
MVNFHRLLALSGLIFALAVGFFNVWRATVVQDDFQRESTTSSEPYILHRSSHFQVIDGNDTLGTSATTTVSPRSAAGMHHNASAAASFAPDYRQSIRDLNVLLFVTTIFSHQHVEYLNCCWPGLMERSHFLPNAHVMVFGNNYTKQPQLYTDQIRSLFEHNPSFHFRFAPPHRVESIARLSTNTRLQLGANLGLELGFQNRWFQAHDWILRINPDVLIRQSDWIVETMSNDTVDGIFVMCTPRKVHTDFFAVRTKLFNQSAFSRVVENNHERTAYTYFQSILESGRYALLPQERPSRGFCRVGAHNSRTSMVYHGHDSCGSETTPPPSNDDDANGTTAIPRPTCNALEGWEIN